MRPDRWEEVKVGFHAALDLEPEARPAFVATTYAHDPEVCAQIGSLLASHDASYEFLERPAVVHVGEDVLLRDTPPPIERIGPYSIIREIGRGGMGTVYLASRDDGQFAQRVALKIVKRGMDTDAIIARFRQERQILAALEHPHIARLFDGGTTADGVPYFVMEYVEGQSIADYCRTRTLSARDRLTLFRTVCGAVEYAHQNLIVHRDIKSSNIVVSADGVPKLLDFGIAKVITPTDGAGVRTETAGAMTPDYASPEQLRGEPVTTATDVYSLGVLLYELLTGQRPFASASSSGSMRSDAFVKAVTESDPPAPSATVAMATSSDLPLTSQQLRGDLDTIVLKAIQREPQRRYSSIERLAEDITRYLEQRPVLAQPDTVGYRLSKFVRRHRAALAVTTVVVLTALGGVGATLWQARVAERERARAERRFAEIRSLATTFLFDINDEIAPLAGATATRGKVIAKAVESLAGLAKEAAGDTLLERELSEAYQRLGSVQGNTYFSNLGESEKALASYETAVTLARRGTDTTSRNRAALMTLANAYGGLSTAQTVVGKLPEAVANLERSRALIERAVALDSSDIASQRALAEAYYGLGDSYGGIGMPNVGEPVRSIAAYRSAVAIRERMLQRWPNDPEVRGGLANTLLNWGSLALSRDDSTGASQIARGVRLLEQLVRDDSTNAERRNNLLSGYLRQRRPLADAGRFDEALAADTRVLAILKKMVTVDTANALLQRNLGVTYNTLGFDLLGANRVPDGVAAHQEALRIARQLVANDPASLEMQQDLAFTHHALGDAFRAAQRYNEAMAAYRQAVQVKRMLREREPQNSRHAPDLAEMYSARAATQLAMRRLGEAESDVQAAVALIEPIVAQKDVPSRLRNVAADVFGLAGEVHVAQAVRGDGGAKQMECAKAQPWLQRSGALWEALAKDRAVNSRYRARPEAVRRAAAACGAT